jgi:hypothetical protein
MLVANSSGLCMCGCGRKTKIVTKSDRRHGHVMGQPFRFIHGHSRPAAKGPNRFKLRLRTAVIFLERRDGAALERLVSRKDFRRVRRHHWYANKNGKGASYAVAWIDGAQVQMHKHLCPNWAQVNHQNGNGLDNRRENLRGGRRVVSAKRTPSCKDSRRIAMLRHDQALKEGLDEVAKAGFRAGT